MKYIVLLSGDQPGRWRCALLEKFFQAPFRGQRIQRTTGLLLVMVHGAATKRPRTSHLPSLKRLLEGSPLGEASVSNLLVSGSKVQNPKRCAITSPRPCERRHPTKSSSCRKSLDRRRSVFEHVDPVQGLRPGIPGRTSPRSPWHCNRVREAS